MICSQLNAAKVAWEVLFGTSAVAAFNLFQPCHLSFRCMTTGRHLHLRDATMMTEDGQMIQWVHLAMSMGAGRRIAQSAKESGQKSAVASKTQSSFPMQNNALRAVAKYNVVNVLWRCLASIIRTMISKCAAMYFNSGIDSRP